MMFFFPNISIQTTSVTLGLYFQYELGGGQKSLSNQNHQNFSYFSIFVYGGMHQKVKNQPKITSFCVMTPCTLFDGYRCFREIPALKTEGNGVFRNFGADIRRSPRHIPEDRQPDIC